MPQPAVSRILSAFARLRERPRDDHSSRPGIADGLKRPTRKLRTGRSLVRLRPCGRRRDIASLFGLAPCGVLPAICLTADAVRSYRTFSPLPTFALDPSMGGLRRASPLAACSPKLSSCEASRAKARRYVFCATSPSGYPDRALPGALPCGVRTFLSPCGKRSSGPLRHSIVLHPVIRDMGLGTR